MACYHPIPAFQGGSEPPRLYPPVGTANLELPCGKCIGCRTDRATHWALRAEHEASRWEHNTFLTLTYDDDSLPPNGHLVAAHLRNFLKRLRKNADSPRSRVDSDRSATRANGTPIGIRYLACGEYGDRTGRPHYHAVLFNCGFSDAEPLGGQSDTRKLFTSETVGSCWTDPKTGRPYGNHSIGDATGAAAAYVAQYTLKKQYIPREWGPDRRAGYWEDEWVDPETGEYFPPRFIEKPQPFLRMSLRPAIGYTWLQKYSSDLTHGYIVANGRRHGIPRYYKDKLTEVNSEAAELAEYLTQRRKIQNPTDNNEPARRIAAEIIHKRRKEITNNRTL